MTLTTKLDLPQCGSEAGYGYLNTKGIKFTGVQIRPAGVWYCGRKQR